MSADMPTQPTEPAGSPRSPVETPPVVTSRPAGRRLNWWLLLTVLAMAAFSATQVVSYFMQWSHYYPTGGQPWPMVDLADSQPFTPWDFVSQNPPGTANGMIVFFLATPVSYVVCGLLGMFATKRLKRALGGLNLIVASINILLIIFLMSFPLFNDGTWPRSTDSGASVGFLASLLMVSGAIIFFFQEGGLFTRVPARARARLSFADTIAPVP